MKRPDYIPRFSKAVLAGALTGIAATIFNLIYNVAFRSVTRYFPSEEFSFFSITFASIIISMLIGMMLFVFIKYMSMKAFIAAMIIIAAACVCITAFVHSNPTESAFYGNHGLLAGFIIITGVLSITLLPYLYNHPKIFV